MTQQKQVQRHGSYGIDAPYALGFLAILVVIYFGFATMVALNSGRVWPFLPVLFMFTISACMFHTTLRGKFLIWAALLDKLALRGDERILDLGCGRGAVMLMAAQHLTTGLVVGVDLWQSADQSSNSAAATQRNAVAEGVADRIELHTGNMTALPFEDNSFDVVLSSLAIHNISRRTEREKAINEAMRVLRPGGRLVIADIRVAQQYQSQLAKSGMHDVTGSRLGWQFWWGGPWAATRLVTATKPEHLIALA